MISYDYLLELSFLLDSGVSMIEVIKNKLALLCKREGLKFKPDNNVGSMIERFAVATNAVVITGIITLPWIVPFLFELFLGDDLDNIICLVCGIVPKTVLSDGNSKVL